MEISKNNFVSPLEYFYKQVQNHSSDIAVCCNEELSFYELDILSNKLANYMLANGIKRQEPIAILINKDIRTIISMLGAWKIGCPFIPIDIEAPEKRIKYILETCQIKFCVVDTNASAKWSKDLLKDRFSIFLDSTNENEITWENVLNESSKALNYSQSEDDLVYTIFTSGSTGQPKGVMITAQNLSFFIKWCIDFTGINEKMRVLNIANFSFDQSVMDIAFMIGCGAELHLFSSLKHPLIISDYIQKNAIQIISAVPSIFAMLFDEKSKLQKDCFSSLKKIFIGGAACPPHFVSLFHEKMPGAEIYNMYGPTEVTVYCMFHKFKQNELEQGLKKVPLGKSFPNHFIQLVDHDKKSTNNKGELVVYGPQVMKGYWGDKNTTDNVFITDSKYQFKGYLTGDIVKKEKDNIFFVGRTNETIKTSGYRVDTSEIESAIMNCEPVKDVAVISKPDTLLENILFAFIMLKDGYEMNEADIKNTISKNIPSYMIPKKIINIEQFPLNPSGKTDKRELKKMLNNFL